MSRLRFRSTWPGWTPWDGGIEPWSAAVRGERSDGTWDACQTIVVFGFTEIPVARDVWRLCETSLCALNASSACTRRIAKSRVRGGSRALLGDELHNAF